MPRHAGEFIRCGPLLPPMADDGGERVLEWARDDSRDVLERLIRSGRLNALLAWVFVAILATVFIDSVIDRDRLWMVFVATTGVIVLVPPVAFRDWRAMLPWEMLAVAMAPILVRGLVGGELGTFATYVSLAGLALVITVELHRFTTIRVTHWFAVTFVVLTTMAAAALWAIVRYLADGLLGTAYLTSNEALMVEFTAVALAGLVAGVLFDSYFRRRDVWLRRALRGVLR